MSGYVEMGRVIHNTQIGSDVWRLSIYAPKQAKEAQLGQFCNVRVTGGTAPLLRRPISYAGFDAEAGTIDLLYRVAGQEAHVILGFRNASESFWADLFKDSPVTVHITTDDGSLGTKGYPTSVMETLMKEEQFDAVLTCGPTPMMKGVAAVAQQMGVPCQVSLEERMGCGTGGCVGCACQGKSGTRYKVCKDGPVFPAEEVFF